MTFDASNVHGVPPGESYSEFAIALALCGLLQIPVGPLELLVGPKAGYTFVHAERRTLGSTDEFRGNGLVAGIDSGAFVPVSPATSLGVVLSLELRTTQHICQKTTGVETCTSNNANWAELVGVSAAALF
jgi:hypothetical protein